MLEVHSYKPNIGLHGLVAGIYCYRDDQTPSEAIEPAPLTFPLIFSLANPWSVGFGTEAFRHGAGGFTAGLYAGPVRVASRGGTDCVQVDLTLRGAMRLYGGLAADLAGHVVELAELPGLAGQLSELQDMLSETTDRSRRFELVEQFLLRGFSHQECQRTIAAWRCLAKGQSVRESAAAVGWSTRHLNNRVKATCGLKPVAVSRMMRLHRATALAKTGDPRWAEIAVEAGYSDQAHLVREFRSLAGETPTAWVARNIPAQAPFGLPCSEIFKTKVT